MAKPTNDISGDELVELPDCAEGGSGGRTQSERVEYAQRELESLLPQLESAVIPDVLIAWWYLGELHREQGDTEKARNAYQEYLGRTLGIDDSKVVRLRGLASQALENLTH